VRLSGYGAGDSAGPGAGVGESGTANGGVAAAGGVAGDGRAGDGDGGADAAGSDPGTATAGGTLAPGAGAAVWTGGGGTGVNGCALVPDERATGVSSNAPASIWASFSRIFCTSSSYVSMSIAARLISSNMPRFRR
jgi:hypothetical protein